MNTTQVPLDDRKGIPTLPGTETDVITLSAGYIFRYTVPLEPVLPFITAFCVCPLFKSLRALIFVR